MLTTLLALVAVGAITAGAFAIFGAFLPGAPQFTVTVYHLFQTPLVAAYGSIGAGTILLVGLVAYAIHSIRKERERTLGKLKA